MVGCAATLAAATPLFANFPGIWQELSAGLTAALGALLLTLVFVHWERLRLKDVGVAPGSGSLGRLLLGFIAGLLIVGIWASALILTCGLKLAPEPHPLSAHPAIQLAVYVVLSCREELGFHGFPLRRLNQVFGLWPAQILVALIFALEHKVGGSSWVQAFLGSGMGSLLFGMASIATKGLAVPIGMHAAWNFGQWILGLKGAYGVWRVIVPEGHAEVTETIALMIYVALFSSATIVLWLSGRRSTRT
jgi:uncharacterized protein